PMTSLFAFFNLSPMEILVLAIIGVLLFGRKLPEVGRYLGKGIVEFKKGVKGLEDDMDPGVNPGLSRDLARSEAASEQIRAPQRVPATAPKFEDSPTNIPAPPRA